MSEIAPFGSFLKWKVSFESPSLQYIAKTVTRNVLFAVAIPFPLLKAWHDFLRKTPRTTSVDQSPSTSAGTSQELALQYTYTDLLEFSIPGSSFGLSEDPAIRTEIHKRLQKLAGTVSSEYKKSKGGRKSRELDKRSRRFHIYEGQTVDLMALKKKKELIKEELQEWKKSYSDLELERKTLLYQEMQMAIQEKDI